MSAPYWGKLPAPKAAVPTRQDRHSDDYGAALDHPDGQPRQQPHRISVQTTNTEDPADSTLSPFASPTASSFLGHGLAPRPPSYQPDATDYPPDIADRRAHRRSRTRDDTRDFEFDAATPPAVPEVPRAPPLSYRAGRFSNSSTPDAYAAAAAAVAASRSASTPASPPVVAMDRAREPQYRSPRDEPRDYFSADPGDPAEPATPRTRIAGEIPLQQVRKGSVREVTTPGRGGPESGQPQPRRPSTTSQAGGSSRKFADDRSPLQKLELTLDSITKEEKRAKVEAAERKARERAARAARAAEAAKETPLGIQQQPRQQQQPQPQQQQYPQVSFRERGASQGDIGEDLPTPTRRPSARAPEQPVAAHRGPLSQNPPQEASRYHEVPQPRALPVPPGPPVEPITPTPAPAPAPDPDYSPEEPPPQPSGGNMGIPKRNLSFRERAARRQDLAPPNGAESGSPAADPVAAPAAAPAGRPQSSGGFSLSRSNSNKLRKDPPGDPWYRLRIEAQNAMRENPQPQPQPQFQSQPQPQPRPLPQPQSQPQPRPLPQPQPQSQPQPRPLPQPQPSDPRNGYSARGPPPRTNPPQSHYDESLLAPAPEVRRARPGPHPEPHPDAVAYTGPPAPQPGIRRNATEPIPSTTQTTVTFDDEPTILQGPASEGGSVVSDHDRREFTPGDGLYLPPKFLDEWRQATVGSLGGPLLNLHEKSVPPVADPGRAWWEEGPKGKGMSSRPRKAEAFDGEYAETNGPTRFKPPLYVECGPLLRYCGLRRELAAKSARDPTIVEREIWRGSIMIVTQDEGSDYDIAPTLRLFLQPLEPLPPPPVEVNGDLSPEYVDPIAGHPKLGRRGETIYVRPVEHLEEGVDLSLKETDEGLFEASRSPPDVPLPEGMMDLPGSYASRHRRIKVDGEKVAKYKDVRGFRLHEERGLTFWRFNIEVELSDAQQRVAYRINRGPALGFWVPARGTPMNVAFHSSNGFGLDVGTNDLSGPDPMWRDVLNTHQARPFHAMIGGGGQIFNDAVLKECTLFRRWLGMRSEEQKYGAPFLSELQDELESFYLRRYCSWFSRGMFALAASHVPMVNMWDDREVLDGYGSYPRHLNGSPVFCGLGAVAMKYYMLFQHQSVADETEASEPSWITGVEPGPYVGALSRSLIVDLGAGVSLLAVDCRTERTEMDVVAEATWEKIMDRCYRDVKTGVTKHLLVVLPVPIAYPRLDWLEKTMGSRLMSPFKKLGRSGKLGSAMHQLEGDNEIRDELNDHWTAKNRKGERRDVIEQLQDLAAIKSVRVTLLSGNVNLTAVGHFYSHPRFQLPKHKDFRYMPNITASPIANSPPPPLMVDVLNRRNKVHHFDKDTDEAMIPLFAAGVDGKVRGNKRMLPHRNWCSIRAWAPGNTPPGTPEPSVHERTPSPPPSRAGSLFRRFSKRKNSVSGQDSPRDVSRPPISGSGSGGFFRSLSRRNSSDAGRPPVATPGKLTRSLSVSRADFSARRLVGLEKPASRPQYQEPEPYDAPVVNGNGHGHGHGGQPWDQETEPYGYYDYEQGAPGPPRSRLRGGGDREYEQGDEALFTARPVRPPQPTAANPDDFVPKPFHRTPTGLSIKQLKRADDFAVDLEDGLDICINAEVSPRDPAGITVPYRILVPRLFHDEDDERRHDEMLAAEVPEKGFKRFLSFGGKKGKGQGKGEVQEQGGPGGMMSGEESEDEAEEVEEVPRQEHRQYHQQVQQQQQYQHQQHYQQPQQHHHQQPQQLQQPHQPHQPHPQQYYPQHRQQMPQQHQRQYRQYSQEPEYYDDAEWR